MTSPFSKIFDEAGGEEGVEKILNVFYQTMAKDILLSHFFVNKDLAHIAHQQKGFMMKAMGLSKTYQGKSLSHAHLEIPPIYQGHFDRRLVLLREVLASFGMSPEIVELWVRFEKQFEKVVVK